MSALSLLVPVVAGILALLLILIAARWFSRRSARA
jgi:hypothetical protein